MSQTKAAPTRVEKPEDGARPCLNSIPYRTLVFSRNNGTSPLYWVAGIEGGPWGAENALRKAAAKHGSECFYCKKKLDAKDVTIDHVEGRTGAAAAAIQNLVLACKPCNTAKAHQPIDVFKPQAGKEWLSAVLQQVEERLKNLA